MDVVYSSVCGMLSSRQAQETLAQLLCLCLLCRVNGGCSISEVAARTDNCLRLTCSPPLGINLPMILCEESWSIDSRYRIGGFKKHECGAGFVFFSHEIVNSGLKLKFYCQACSGTCQYVEWVYGTSLFQGSQQLCRTHDQNSVP